MKTKLLILLAVLGISSNSFSEEPIDLFIWAGQSNAQGWEGDADFYPPDPTGLDNQIRLNYTFIESTRSNGWIEMQPQEGRFESGHFGPEVTFARKLVEAGYNPAIFKYSRGSTSIHADWLAPGEGGYYDAMVADLQIAIADLESQGHSVDIRGLVWIQGESDAETPDIASAFEVSLLSIISDLRNNVAGNKALPIILGVDEQHHSVVRHPVVLEAHKTIARNDDQIIFTSMYGLSRADAYHLAPAGLVAHGERIFQVLDFLLAESPKTLVSALNSLRLHITGDTPLAPSAIAEHKSTIDAFKSLFGANRAIIEASFKLVEAYDTEMGPLWVSGSSAQNFERANIAASDIHRLVYTVMQNIIDETYTESNIEDYEDLFSKFKFGSSAYFPGACDAPEDPDKSYSAKIDASFPKTFGRHTMYWTTPARKPTGTYLAPGTIATVIVPQALVGKGYKVRVGSHSWDFFRLPELHRLDRVSLLYDINATELRVSSPLGGGIYIEVPYLSDEGIVEIGIRNAVPSPYFSAKPFHTTTLEEWKNIQRHHKAPWADFQTEKFMMNVPTDWIYELEDPTSLLAEWDLSMDATNELMGFPVQRGKETLYAQVDLAIPYGFHATGYPAVNAWYDPNESYGGDHDDYLVTSPKHADYVEFHEMGHGYLFPKLATGIESTVNLLHVAVLNRKLGFSLDEAFQKSAPPADTSRTIDDAAVVWMMMQDFKNNKPMDILDKSYQHQGHANYVEIVRLFGWDVLAKYWRTYMLEEPDASPIDNGNTDPILLKLSRAIDVDVRPLFHFWGVHPDKPTALEKAIEAEKLLPSMEIYRTLKRYQTLVPPDKAAFHKFALNWWGGKKDKAESKFAASWHSYDEAYTSLVQSTVQDIIDLYFPDGPPAVVGQNDLFAPTPNPITFLIPPAATGELSISMTAADAEDDSWVQYYFANTTIDGHDSGWQNRRVYEDNGLEPNTVYAYTVKTRDFSPAQNTGEPSGPASARTNKMDSVSPLPKRMHMTVAPVATSPSIIYMEATTATDPSGVEYFFTCTVGNCNDSGWQQDASYTDTGLNSETTYSYSVTARDKSPQGNKNGASASLSTITKAATDEPYLVMDKPVYAVGEDIVVHYVASAGERSRWVGLFNPPTNAKLSESDGIQFQYLTKAHGRLVFNGLSAGSYQARLHYNDGYPIEARVEFAIK